eukprot:14806737-Alexandrium_andersonii.AAC.1
MSGRLQLQRQLCPSMGSSDQRWRRSIDSPPVPKGTSRAAGCSFRHACELQALSRDSVRPCFRRCAFFPVEVPLQPNSWPMGFGSGSHVLRL